MEGIPKMAGAAGRDKAASRNTMRSSVVRCIARRIRCIAIGTGLFVKVCSTSGEARPLPMEEVFVSGRTALLVKTIRLQGTEPAIEA